MDNEYCTVKINSKIPKFLNILWYPLIPKLWVNIEIFIKLNFRLSNTNNLYPLSLAALWHDCQRNMGAQLPTERIWRPKPCWHKHTKIGVCCASSAGGVKYVIFGIRLPYFGGGLVFTHIIWADTTCCRKKTKKMMPRRFSASWNNAKFRHLIPGRRKLARHQFFADFLTTSGNCRIYLAQYLAGPEISGVNSKKCAH